MLCTLLNEFIIFGMHTGAFFFQDKRCSMVSYFEVRVIWETLQSLKDQCNFNMHKRKCFFLFLLFLSIKSPLAGTGVLNIIIRMPLHGLDYEFKLTDIGYDKENLLVVAFYVASNLYSIKFMPDCWWISLSLPPIFPLTFWGFVIFLFFVVVILWL